MDGDRPKEIHDGTPLLLEDISIWMPGMGTSQEANPPKKDHEKGTVVEPSVVSYKFCSLGSYLNNILFCAASTANVGTCKGYRL